MTEELESVIESGRLLEESETDNSPDVDTVNCEHLSHKQLPDIKTEHLGYPIVITPDGTEYFKSGAYKCKILEWAECEFDGCGKTYPKVKTTQRFCVDKCRIAAYHQKKLNDINRRVRELEKENNQLKTALADATRQIKLTRVA